MANCPPLPTVQRRRDGDFYSEFIGFVGLDRPAAESRREDLNGWHKGRLLDNIFEERLALAQIRVCLSACMEWGNRGTRWHWQVDRILQSTAPAFRSCRTDALCSLLEQKRSGATRLAGTICSLSPRQTRPTVGE